MPLIRESASLVRGIPFGWSEVGIEEHLALHEEKIHKLVRRQVSEYSNPDDYDELKQVIYVDLWKRHENGYDHNGGASLLTYAYPYLKPLISKTLDEYRHFKEKWGDSNKPLLVVIPTASGDDECLFLEDLEKMAQEEGRNRLYLEPLYDEPTPGLKRPIEETLSPEDRELVEKLKANLTEEELAILGVSDRSCEAAAEFLRGVKGMKISTTTYWRKLADARARAKSILAQGVEEARGS
jgi:predicted DNA-binding protein (UPF0251 family)